jgi:hypothetical protein
VGGARKATDPFVGPSGRWPGPGYRPVRSGHGPGPGHKHSASMNPVRPFSVIG